MPRPRQPHSPFRYFNSSPEAIRLAVLLYVKYPLSLRNVEDLLAKRGIDTFPVGGGWWVTKNYLSGDISTRNRGLTFRLNPPESKINIDIAAGLKLPDGRHLELNETCHYQVP